MSIRVERDTVITVPSIGPGGEERSVPLELREADSPASVCLYGHQYGNEVRFDDLREALDKAEAEFAPSLRSA
jgi:hypothetical protein